MRWKAGVSNRGKSPSEETRQKMGESRARYLATHQGPFRDTLLERQLRQILEVEGIDDLVPQQPFGRYVVDFYSPSHNTAYEADGAYWHDKPEQYKKDASRDMSILFNFAVPVVRYSELEIQSRIQLVGREI